MTTNKKKTKKNKDPESSKSTSTIPATANRSTTTPPLTQPGILSKAQLTTLILLSLALSRIFQLGGAWKDYSDDIVSEEDGGVLPNKLCVEHLSLEACQDAGLNVFLRLKYHSAIQSALLACAALLQCWNTELALTRLNALFIASPLLTSLTVLQSSKEWMNASAILRQSMMIIVLGAVALPPASLDALPFISVIVSRKDDRYRRKTLQSLALVTFSLLQLVQAVQLIWPLFQGESAETVVMTQLLNVDIQTPAVTPILGFLLVDKATNALLFAFAWYYFVDASQRSFLLHVSVIKAIEYFYQTPLFQGVLVDVSAAIAAPMAFFSALCWIAPNLSWKPKTTPTTKAI